MFLKFEKWHGCKNDFIVIATTRSELPTILPSLQRQAARLCSRSGAGIGADGILLLCYTQVQASANLQKTAVLGGRSASASLTEVEELLVINADGSLAANCGNGLRCAAASVFKRWQEEGVSKRQTPSDEVSLVLAQASYWCHLLAPAQPSGSAFVAVSMGVPKLNAANPWHEEACSRFAALATEAKTAGLSVGSCTLGNAHVVIHAGAALSSPAALVQQFGPALQKGASWDGINVHVLRPCDAEPDAAGRLVQALGEAASEWHELCSWERGVGLTQACGSGASAAAALILDEGLTPRQQWVGIVMPGGCVAVKQSEAADALLLAGPAEWVFSGSLEL